MQKTHGSDIITQIMYPDTDHVLIPGGNGAWLFQANELWWLFGSIVYIAPACLW